MLEKATEDGKIPLVPEPLREIKMKLLTLGQLYATAVIWVVSKWMKDLSFSNILIH